MKEHDCRGDGWTTKITDAGKLADMREDHEPTGQETP